MNFRNIRALCLTTLLSLCLASPAPGGDVFNNGGGISEQNFLFAWLNLESFLEPCKRIFQKCEMTLPEYNLVFDIANGLGAERAGRGLEFKSGKLNPGLFEPDEHGEPRIAVTGSTVGSGVIINLDLLYPVRDGSREPIDVMTAAAVLVHELGHHHGIKDHAYLDRLASKIKARAQMDSESIRLKQYQQNRFMVTAVNPVSHVHDGQGYPGRPDLVQLYWSNGVATQDFSSQLENLIQCEGRSQHFVTMALNNLHWLRLPRFDASSRTQSVAVGADISWSCEASGPVAHNFFTGTVEFSARFAVKEISVWDWYGKVTISEPRFEPAQWAQYKDDALLEYVKDSFEIRLIESQ